ncbi:MAG: Trm112 family protein [Candidatus Bathyarchaeia archaeon]
MKRKLIDILACPIDKFYPLELQVFEEKEEIGSGIITCPKCNRWYPIIDEIPHMLPDDLREQTEDIPFLEKWKAKIPAKVLSEGRPFNLKGTSP